ncbi:unnamed protein product, partial [marine sediment metagenome]
MKKVNSSHNIISINTVDDIINKISSFSSLMIDQARGKVGKTDGLSSDQLNTRISLIQYSCIIYKAYYEAALLEVERNRFSNNKNYVLSSSPGDNYPYNSILHDNINNKLGLSLLEIIQNNIKIT